MLNEPNSPIPISTIRHPWEAESPIPDRPKDWDYGYVLLNKAYGCTREGLIKIIVIHGTAVTRVWTPGSSEAVRPETVDFLIAGFQQRIRKDARFSILVGIALAGLAAILAIVVGEWRVLYRSFFGVFGLFGIAEGTWSFYKSKSHGRADVQAEFEAAQFTAWVEKKKVSGYTVGLIAAIILVCLLQLLTGGLHGENQSINAAGLVKPAVWQGQVWRLATATLMHVNFTHIWMNLASLLYLSRMIEQRISSMFLPLVFFTSGISGSILSLLLYPNTTSVGASGGIMGLLGFATAAAWIHRGAFPTRFYRNLLGAIAFTGVFGLIGFAFIDNAAHLGGLLCGAGLGFYFLRERLYPGKRVKSLSIVSLILILLTAAFAVHQLLKLI